MAMTGQQTSGPNGSFPECIPRQIPFEQELATDILRVCIKRRTVRPIDKSTEDFLFDLDELTGLRCVGPENRNSELRNRFYEAFSAVIAQLLSVHPVDAAAFYVRSQRVGGPWGLHPVGQALRDKNIPVPVLFVNPALPGEGSISPRHLLQELPNYSKIVALTDVTASGDEALDTAIRLCQYTAREVHILSLFDTDEGARQNLARLALPLTVVMSADDFEKPTFESPTASPD
jgi:hypothetical protein